MKVFLWQRNGTDTIYEVPNEQSIEELIRRIEKLARGPDVEVEMTEIRNKFALCRKYGVAEIHKFFTRHRHEPQFEFGRFYDTEKLK